MPAASTTTAATSVVASGSRRLDAVYAVTTPGASARRAPRRYSKEQGLSVQSEKLKVQFGLQKRTPPSSAQKSKQSLSSRSVPSHCASPSTVLLPQNGVAVGVGVGVRV